MAKEAPFHREKTTQNLRGVSEGSQEPLKEEEVARREQPEMIHRESGLCLGQQSGFGCRRLDSRASRSEVLGKSFSLASLIWGSEFVLQVC